MPPRLRSMIPARLWPMFGPCTCNMALRSTRPLKTLPTGLRNGGRLPGAAHLQVIHIHLLGRCDTRQFCFSFSLVLYHSCFLVEAVLRGLL